MNTAARINAIATTESADFLHRFNRGIARRHAFVDQVLDGLDHNDGVIDDQADRQHQSKQRKRIDGESQEAEI